MAHENVVVGVTAGLRQICGQIVVLPDERLRVVECVVGRGGIGVTFRRREMSQPGRDLVEWADSALLPAQTPGLAGKATLWTNDALYFRALINFRSGPRRLRHVHA